MCGKTIHMFPQLLRVLKMRFQNKVISLPPSETPYKAFMFAKEDCWYSQRANEILQQRLAINPKDICIVGNPNSDNPGYLCAEKWTFIDSNKDLIWTNGRNKGYVELNIFSEYVDVKFNFVSSVKSKNYKNLKPITFKVNHSEAIS